MRRLNTGAHVPVDGRVTDGSFAVGESLVTGGSMPKRKEGNAAVTCGTVSSTGTFLMRAERVSANTLLSQIVDMTAKAQASRAPVQRLADRVSARFVPVVVLIPQLTFPLCRPVGLHPSFAVALVHAGAVLTSDLLCALGLGPPNTVPVCLSIWRASRAVNRGGEH